MIGDFNGWDGNACPLAAHDEPAGFWAGVVEVLNSDAACYGGSGVGNYGGTDTEPVAAHGHAQSLALTLPPLGALYFEPA